MELRRSSASAASGAERRRSGTCRGVYVTAVGYAAGATPNPTYEEVCSGRTGHNEVVLVVFDSDRIGYDAILKTFWEAHDPTQGMRQGNDVGTQYRSGIYTCSESQTEQAHIASRDAYQEALSAAGYGRITTEILEAGPFYYAEDYHQQYLAKDPVRLLRPRGYRSRLSGRRRGVTPFGPRNESRTCQPIVNCKCPTLPQQ